MAEYLQPKGIPADHKDLIEDVSYDFYGRRIATCSLDQNVKVCCWLPLYSIKSMPPNLARNGPINLLHNHSMCVKHDSVATLMYTVLILHPQVWDMDEANEWKCTSSWKVGWMRGGAIAVVLVPLHNVLG